MNDTLPNSSPFGTLRWNTMRDHTHFTLLAGSTASSDTVCFLTPHKVHQRGDRVIFGLCSCTVSSKRLPFAELKNLTL